MTSNFASLHAGLVARKGEASPATPHPAFVYTDAPGVPAQPVRLHAQPKIPVSRAEPAPSSVVAGAEAVVARPELEAAPAATAKARRKTSHQAPVTPYRLSFRMTVDQRRRIRIAAAQKDTTLQHVLSDALDAYLDSLCACSLNDCACLARMEGKSAKV